MTYEKSVITPQAVDKLAEVLTETRNLLITMVNHTGPDETSRGIVRTGLNSAEIDLTKAISSIELVGRYIKSQEFRSEANEGT